MTEKPTLQEIWILVLFASLFAMVIIFSIHLFSLDSTYKSVKCYSVPVRIIPPTRPLYFTVCDYPSPHLLYSSKTNVLSSQDLIGALIHENIQKAFGE